MKAARFVIVQHGEKRRQPGDPGLTAHGHEQASSAAVAVAALGVLALYSSPMRRASETASAIARATGLDVQVDGRPGVPACGFTTVTGRPGAWRMLEIGA